MSCACKGTWREPCLACYQQSLRDRIASPTPTQNDLDAQLQKAGVPGNPIAALREPLLANEAMMAGKQFMSRPAALCHFLTLLGRTGKGKTHTSVWVMNEKLRLDGWNNSPTGGHALPVMFIEASRLTSVSAYEKVDEQWVEELKTVPLLVIDDAGDEATTIGKDILTNVLLHRSGKLRRSVVTSNLRKAPFEARYGAALLDRMTKYGIVVELGGQSFRKDRNQEAPR